MLRRIETLGYRCLRHVEVELDDFQILVGPNAAGKSTLLDAVVFLGEFITDGILPPVRRRTSNFQDLVWNRPAEDLGFEIAIEMDLPSLVGTALPDEKGHERIRYEIAVRVDRKTGLHVDRERWFPVPASALVDRHAEQFPHPRTAPETIFKKPSLDPESPEGRDPFLYGDRTKMRPPGNGDRQQWKGLSALGFFLPDPARLRWFETDLWNVATVALDNRTLRRPSPPDGSLARLEPDGSNLPWMVQLLKTRYPDDYREWLAHVQCVIPELAEVSTIERPEDRHAYLVLDYGAGLSAPSWTISDGTLRMLALTLLAYLPNRPGRCLVEEPENGIHPLALDAVYDSLRSMDDSQVFVSTHSPTLVQRADAKEILCFAKDADGATDIVRGDRHPRLRDWLDSADTSLVFATGVFG